jgi:hypothetical protein
VTSTAKETNITQLKIEGIDTPLFLIPYDAKGNEVAGRSGQLTSQQAVNELAGGRDARLKAQTRAGDPARRAKIAAAKRGKPRPPHVVEAMRKGRLGTPHSAGARAKMSEAHRRRGTRPPKAARPWTEAENQLVRTLPAAEVARLTGRTLVAVWARRRVLQLPDGRRKARSKP